MKKLVLFAKINFLMLLQKIISLKVRVEYAKVNNKLKKGKSQPFFKNYIKFDRV